MGRRSFRMHGPVISSEARDPGQKTKISQSQPLASFETRSFQMTKVDLSWPSGGFRKRPHARYAALIPIQISRTRINGLFVMTKSDNDEAI